MKPVYVIKISENVHAQLVETGPVHRSVERAFDVVIGPEVDQVFLILFGTGFRGRSEVEAVTATIGDEEAEVLFASGLAGFAGLDQANVRLPRSLAGKGEVSIQFNVEDRLANVVTVTVK